ncbi:hypothetical protein QTN25_004520 [Entamoeba marina]
MKTKKTIRVITETGIGLIDKDNDKDTNIGGFFTFGIQTCLVLALMGEGSEEGTLFFVHLDELSDKQLVMDEIDKFINSDRRDFKVIVVANFDFYNQTEDGLKNQIALTLGMELVKKLMKFKSFDVIPMQCEGVDDMDDMEYGIELTITKNTFFQGKSDEFDYEQFDKDATYFKISKSRLNKRIGFNGKCPLNWQYREGEKYDELELGPEAKDLIEKIEMSNNDINVGIKSFLEQEKKKEGTRANVLDTFRYFNYENSLIVTVTEYFKYKKNLQKFGSLEQ